MNETQAQRENRIQLDFAYRSGRPVSEFWSSGGRKFTHTYNMKPRPSGPFGWAAAPQWALDAKAGDAA